MREPYDDIDPDKEEQRIAKKRQRLFSLKCPCGRPKESGQMQCPQCEEWDWQEMVRLNPPSPEE